MYKNDDIDYKDVVYAMKSNLAALMMQYRDAWENNFIAEEHQEIILTRFKEQLDNYIMDVIDWCNTQHTNNLITMKLSDESICKIDQLVEQRKFTDRSEAIKSIFNKYINERL